jgi:hypothetical protein
MLFLVLTKPISTPKVLQFLNEPSIDQFFEGHVILGTRDTTIKLTTPYS